MAYGMLLWYGPARFDLKIRDETKTMCLRCLLAAIVALTFVIFFGTRIQVETPAGVGVKMICPSCLSNEFVDTPGVSGNGFPSLFYQKVRRARSQTSLGGVGPMSVLKRPWLWDYRWVITAAFFRPLSCALWLTGPSGSRRRRDSGSSPRQVSVQKHGVPHGPGKCPSVGRELGEGGGAEG